MRGQLSVRYITTLCLLATGIYGQMMERSDGIDTGNTLCVGDCVTSVHELRCEAPTVPFVCEHLLFLPFAFLPFPIHFFLLPDMVDVNANQCHRI